MNLQNQPDLCYVCKGGFRDYVPVQRHAVYGEEFPS